MQVTGASAASKACQQHACTHACTHAPRLCRSRELQQLVKHVSSMLVLMLVLMRPDYAGHGSFGLKCLEEYEGEYLVLVGEWEVKKTKSQAYFLS